jgi:hypothetical protein
MARPKAEDYEATEKLIAALEADERVEAGEARPGDEELARDLLHIGLFAGACSRVAPGLEWSALAELGWLRKRR